MLIYEIQEYPKITIRFGDSDINIKSYETFIVDFHEILRFAVSKGDRIKLFIVGDTEAKSPDIFFWGKVARDLLTHLQLFKDGIDKTAIYQKTAKLDRVFDFMFKIYTPTRPLKFFSDELVALTWLSE